MPVSMPHIADVHAMNAPHPRCEQAANQMRLQIERNAQQVAAHHSNASLIVKEMGLVKQEVRLGNSRLGKRLLTWR